MGETKVVSPDLTPDWLEKRRGIMFEIDGQLIRGAMTLDQLQAVVEHRSPFEPKVEKPTAPVLVPSVFSATMVWETADTVTFHVKIKRGNWTPQELIASTKRVQYTTASVVSTMPLITGGTGVVEEFDYVMYKIGRRINDAQVEPERTKYQLTRDLEVQVLLNREFLEFADQHPNGDSWQDTNGKWSFADFDQRGAERLVIVHRHALDWDVSYWFGGRKS